MTKQKDKPQALVITRLRVENIKGAKLVEIVPPTDQHLIILAGKNGQGKSSALNSLIYALGGKKVSGDKPLRNGTKKGEIELVLGERIASEEDSYIIKDRYLVRRVFTEKDAYLYVTDLHTDAPATSAQNLLDSIRGDLTFDVGAFARLKDKDMRDTLLRVTGLGAQLAQYDADREALYHERTTINHGVTLFQSQLVAYDDLPEVKPEPVDIAEQTKALRERRDLEMHWDGLIRDNLDRNRQQEVCRNRIKDLRLQIDQLTMQVQAIEREIEQLATAAEVAEEQYGALCEKLDTGPTADDLEQRIEAADATNTIARRFGERGNLRERLDDAIAKSESATRQIAAIDTAKQELLQWAEMPIPDLAVTDDNVTYRGVPVRECSESERFMVGFAIGMKANPTLKVVRADLNDLDEETLRAVDEMARKHGYYVWGELVDRSGAGNVGIVLREGRVHKINP